MTDQDIPRSVRMAVRLMYAGAVLSLLSFVLGAFRAGDIADLARSEAAQEGMPASQANNVVIIGVVLAIVLGLIGAGLWVWMAIMNRRGKHWARILATVFFGFATLGLVQTLWAPAGDTVNTILQALAWLIGLGAVFFMWRGESHPHYARQQPQPYPGSHPPPGASPQPR